VREPQRCRKRAPAIERRQQGAVERVARAYGVDRFSPLGPPCASVWLRPREQARWQVIFGA
jgi:hypothetical protein